MVSAGEWANRNACAACELLRIAGPGLSQCAEATHHCRILHGSSLIHKASVRADIAYREDLPRKLSSFKSSKALNCTGGTFTSIVGKRRSRVKPTAVRTTSK